MAGGIERNSRLAGFGSQPPRLGVHPTCVSKAPKAEALPVTSSMPTEIPKEQEKLFREILELMERESFPYAVSGAFALRQHTGICRVTKDLDLFLTAANLRKVMSFLRMKGYKCAVKDPVWLAKVYKGDFFVDLITGMSNGVIVVKDSWVERASPAMIHGVKTRVLAPEELIASKIFVAKRERFDGADIAHVIFGTYPNFDWARELELVGEHWEMLLWSLLLFRYVYPAQTHYVPQAIWGELLGRLQNRIARPDPQAKFRGSLVDDLMFAIDLNEWRMPNLLEEARRRRLQELKRGAKAAAPVVELRAETARDRQLA